jgi:alkane 1-monooxygenase
LALGGALGGIWGLAAFLWMAFAAVALDVLLPFAAGDAPPDAEFPGSDALLITLGLAALLALPLLTATFAHRPPGAPLLLVALGTGLWLGQVGHPVAHELIHRPARLPRALGVAIYTALLIGHHASAHLLVHHPRVGTARDPNSARAGEGFWRFLPRAWAGSFREGLRVELARGSPAYLAHIGGALAALALAYALAGPRGLLLWLAVSAYVQMQIFLSDYVQHYGLTRATLADGKPAPVSAADAWNAGHWASSALTLNATRHSDHHMHPAVPYPALSLPAEAPCLPWPLPVAACVALYPPLWRRRMQPLLDARKS